MAQQRKICCVRSFKLMKYVDCEIVVWKRQGGNGETRTTPKICQCFYGHTLFCHFGQIKVESESDLAAGSIYSEQRGMLWNVHILYESIRMYEHNMKEYENCTTQIIGSATAKGRSLHNAPSIRISMAALYGNVIWCTQVWAIEHWISPFQFHKARSVLKLTLGGFFSAIFVHPQSLSTC